MGLNSFGAGRELLSETRRTRTAQAASIGSQAAIDRICTVRPQGTTDPDSRSVILRFALRAAGAFGQPGRDRANRARGHSKSTGYSVEVSGGFKGAFSATMGYKSDTTSSEEFRSTVEIPPHRGAELSASPSLHIIDGTWKHGRWWNKKQTHVSVSRPTGHIKWLLRQTRH